MVRCGEVWCGEAWHVSAVIQKVPVCPCLFFTFILHRHTWHLAANSQMQLSGSKLVRKHSCTVQASTDIRTYCSNHASIIYQQGKVPSL